MSSETIKKPKSVGSRLRQAKDNLAAWNQRLDEQWHEVEGSLRALGISKRVAIELESENMSKSEARPYVIERILSFENLAGDWSFYLTNYFEGEAEQGPLPIVESKTRDKVLAIRKLPELLEAVIDEATAEASEIEDALADIADATGSLSGLLV